MIWPISQIQNLPPSRHDRLLDLSEFEAHEKKINSQVKLRPLLPVIHTYLLLFVGSVDNWWIFM